MDNLKEIDKKLKALSDVTENFIESKNELNNMLDICLKDYATSVKVLTESINNLKGVLDES